MPFLQRLLNKDAFVKKENLKSLINHDKFTTDIMLKNQKIEVVEQAKLLGLILTSDLKWNENTNYLVKDANRRMVMLRAASKFRNDKFVLKQIYYTRIRC